jgi:hypothetical protein
MAITSITRYFVGNPNIVSIVDTATLATITTAGYVTGQADNIAALNNGAFEWTSTDEVLISYADGQGFFTYNSTTAAFVAQPTSPGTLSQTLLSSRLFVGNASNIATGVAASGDLTNDNAGVFTIANSAISTAKIAANAVTSAKLALNTLQYTTVAITAAQFNGMYAAPKLLIAAGGANTLIVLNRMDLLMTYVSANYAAGGVAAVQYDSTANGAGVIASTTLSAATFQAAASTGFMFNTGVVPQTFTTCVNKGLYLSNITGAFTTGDSTFVAHIWYTIIPTV